LIDGTYKNMNTLTQSPEQIELAPLPASERIAALDAVRGFALIGICLMNIEFFNRATAEIGQGMPAGLTGINWLASYFVAYFVAGKFWTIFSLLFGMGFAVLLSRAEAAGRSFLKPYLRRIAALAVFGALHHIFLFAGDILFSYAVAAVFLLVVLYGTSQWTVAAIAACIGLALIPGFGPGAGSTAAALAFSGLIALFMRNEQRPLRMPVMALIVLGLSIVGATAAVLMWTLKVGPAAARGPLTAASCLFLILAFLATKYHTPAEARPWRAGAAMYLLIFTMSTIGGLAEYLTPPEPVTPVAAVSAPAPAVARAQAAAAQKKVERAAERAKDLKEHADAVATETRVMSTGSYADVVRLRARHFAKKATGETGFAVVLIAMFLIGTWFIRSGAMANTAAHLPLFRRLAYIALPAGIGIGLAGSLISTSHLAGAEHDGFMLAHSLLMLGNLAASLGYVGMVVLMLNSRSPFGKVRALAPFGRMALTNYLAQSLVMSTVFFGYGLGYWGMGRAWQLVFALALCGVQIACSHWWLARFRYGPAEWLWRAITYLKIPAMRIGPAPGVLHAQPSN
jgi:uncharacterized protein